MIYNNVLHELICFSQKNIVYTPKKKKRKETVSTKQVRIVENQIWALVVSKSTKRD